MFIYLKETELMYLQVSCFLMLPTVRGARPNRASHKLIEFSCKGGSDQTQGFEPSPVPSVICTNKKLKLEAVVADKIPRAAKGSDPPPPSRCPCSLPVSVGSPGHQLPWLLAVCQ